jgi:hypothetical protein
MTNAHDCGVPEQCNGRDDDCDGVIDEEVDDDCKRDHAESRCVSGQCTLTRCTPGYVDCNDSDDDGCERDELEVACGACGRQCDGSTGDAQAEPDAAGTQHERVERDASTPNTNVDADAGVGCGSQSERCDGEDNDCDGNIDESGACDACIALHLSGQTAECDSCACEKCGASTLLCTSNESSTWNTRCVAILQCYGKSNLAGNCPAGNCYENGYCVNEVIAGLNSAAGGGTCSTEPANSACGAALLIRTQCLTTTCASVCKF